MKRLLSTVATAAVLLIAASPVAAQFGIGVKAGSLGLGVDAGIGLGGPLTLRVGAGYLPVDRDGEFSGRTYNVELPPTMVTVGAQLHLTGPLHLVGGVLWRNEDVTFSSDISGSTTIGGTTYTSSGRLDGRMEGQRTAPYLGIGFGSLTRFGVGLYGEVGAAYTGEPTFRMEGSGPISEQPGFEASLREEERRAQDDAPGWVNFWPVVQVGVRIGLGG